MIKANFKLQPTARNIGFVIGLALVAIIFVPLLVIWSLNTLFPALAIPYTWETWAATVLLPSLLKNDIVSKKD